MDQNFLNRGFTDVFDIKIDEELTQLSKLIYTETKPFLVDHNEGISLQQKLNLNFKEIPDTDTWSKLMEKVNSSNELNTLINCNGIKNSFQKIFDNPKIFSISTFRARLPSQKRVIYNWHQDEGTWYLSKNKNQINKYPATLWFSINGASIEDSIQLISFSHKQKLHNHTLVKGQGYFNINKKILEDKNNIITISTKPSQGVIFQPLTIHRSVPPIKISLRPRYTIDIRYYDDEFKKNYKVDFAFKAKKLLKKIF